MARLGVQIYGDAASLYAALGGSTAAMDKWAAEAKADAVAVADSFRGVSTAALETATASDKLAIATAKYGAGTTGAAQATLAYRRNMEGLASSQLAAAESIGRSLSTYVTLPVAAVGYEAAKMATSFQASMLQIQTQAGASASEVKDLTGQVLNLASSGAQQGPNELAQGLFHLESVGLRGAQAMAALKVASNAAAVGMASLEDVATALAGAVTSNIQGAQNYQEAMGTLNATVGAGNMHMSDLLAALGTGLLPKAANVGVTLKEVGAALAVLTDRGIPAAKAATNLGMTFALIAAPSKAAQAALADMGIGATQLRDMLRQPNGLNDVLQLLHDKMAQLGPAVASTDILNAFGRGKSGSGILTLVESLDAPVSTYGDKVAQITATTGNLFTSEQAQQATASAQFHQDLASMEADLIKLGDTMLPTITTIVGGVTKLVGAFEDLPGPVKDAIGIAIGVAAVEGPLLLIAVGAAKAMRAIGLLAGSFRLLGPASLEGAAGAETGLTTVGTEADAASTKVGLLRSRLLALNGLAIVATIEIEEIITHKKQVMGVVGDVAKTLAGVGGHVPFIGGALKDSDLANALTDGKLTWQDIAKGAAAGDKAEKKWWDEIVKDNPKAQLAADKAGIFGPNAYKQQLAANKAFGKLEVLSKEGARLASGPDHGMFPSSDTLAKPTDRKPPKPFTAAQKLQLGLEADPTSAKLLAEQATEDRAKIAAYKKQRLEGNLSNPAFLTDTAPLYAQIAGDTTKGTTSTDKAAAAAKREAAAKVAAVSKDQDLAQARLDLGKGDYTAANQLLATDKARLELELQQADTAQMRLAVTKQLTAVEKQQAAKQLETAIPHTLQVAAARAAAFGDITGEQESAKKIKALELRAISLHELTWQGQIDAYNTIAQQNTILGQGAIDTYKGISASAILAGEHLTRNQHVQIAERLSQTLAHRGYIPQGAGAQGQVVHEVHVTTHDPGQLIAKIEKRKRITHTRSGQRR